MENPLQTTSDFFENLWLELEAEFWLTMLIQAPTPELRRAYNERYFYAATQP